MIFSPLTTFFECRRAGVRSILACGLAIHLAACGTTVEDAVPGARRTGVYPNLNIPQQAATEQLTDEETEAAKAALSATRKTLQAAPSDTTEGDAERLRRLGRSHGSEALEQIER